MNAIDCMLRVARANARHMDLYRSSATSKTGMQLSLPAWQTL